MCWSLSVITSTLVWHWNGFGGSIRWQHVRTVPVLDVVLGRIYAWPYHRTYIRCPGCPLGTVRRGTSVFLEYSMHKLGMQCSEEIRESNTRASFHSIQAGCNRFRWAGTLAILTGRSSTASIHATARKHSTFLTEHKRSPVREGNRILRTFDWD